MNIGNHNGTANKGDANIIPETYETLTTLAEKVLKTHVGKGGNSPLGEILALQINVKLELARQRHDEAVRSPKAANQILAQRDAILGIHADADLQQGGTLKFYLQCAADILASDKNALKDFGFKG